MDYSLSPEAPFPRALEECFYAYCWALQHCRLLGMDPPTTTTHPPIRVTSCLSKCGGAWVHLKGPHSQIQILEKSSWLRSLLFNLCLCKDPESTQDAPSDAEHKLKSKGERHYDSINPLVFLPLGYLNWMYTLQVPLRIGCVWQVTVLEEISASPCPWRPCPTASESLMASWQRILQLYWPPMPRHRASSH